MGTISIDIDLGEGHTSKVSAVMASLGHEPDVPWQRIMGVTTSGLAARNGVSRKSKANDDANPCYFGGSI